MFEFLFCPKKIFLLSARIFLGWGPLTLLLLFGSLSEALQVLIDDQNILNLIDEFTANDVLVEAAAGNLIDVVQILLGDKMANLINRDEIDYALGLAQEYEYNEIFNILNADQRV